MTIDERSDLALNHWLRDTANLALGLQNNFDAAASGRPTKYCMKKTVELEDNYRRRAAAYKKAINMGLIHDSRLPRLYSSLMVPFISQYAKPESP